jgi:hypothetical protein
MTAAATALKAAKLTLVEPIVESPNAEKVDAHALEYKRLEKIVEEAKIAYAAVKKAEGAQLEKLHAALIDLVRGFGGKHAEKSKILHGIEWELMATFGQSYGIDAAAVERLHLALKAAKQTRLLKKLFTEEKSYHLAPNAADVLKAEGKLPDELAMAALACFTFTPRTPQLDVRPKKTT